MELTLSRKIIGEKENRDRILLLKIISKLPVSKKKKYIYRQIGTKLLTSLSGDPLNVFIKTKANKEALLISYID